MSIYTCKTYFDCITHATEKANSFGVGLNSNVILFCEDKLALSFEKALVSLSGGTFGSQVLSFQKYMDKILPKRKTLSKEGASMVVKKILTAESKNLKTFSSIGSTPSLASKTSELIAQLKSAKVTPEALFSCLDGCDAFSLSKIHDIALVFQKYEEFLKENGLTDSNNCLEDMILAIDEDDKIKSTHVIIAGYSSVTKQSCEVIKKLINNALTIDFFAIDGDNKELYTSEFSSFISRETGLSPIELPSVAIPEAKSLLDGLFNPEQIAKEGLYSDKLVVFESRTLADEVDFICSEIKNKVVFEGVRFSDIAIGVGDISNYNLLLKRKLADYGIPFFVDEKKTLSSHPLAKLISSAIRCVTRKNDTDELKKVILNGLFISDKKVADEFLKYMTKGSVTARNFPKSNSFLPSCENYMFLNAKWETLSKFILGFPQKATAKTYAEILKKFIFECGVSTNHEDKNSNEYALAEKLSAIGAEEEKTFLLSSIDKVFGLLDEISEILGDEVLTGDEFNKILSSGEEASEVSFIQEYLDCVYVSDIKNCRAKQYKYLFFAGLTVDVPQVKADTALLLDSDITALESLSVCIEPTIKVVNRREKEAQSVAFASFTDGIYLSYSISTPTGKATTKSEFVDYALAIFSNKKQKATVLTRSILESALAENREDENDLRLLKYSSLRPALFSFMAECDDYKNGASDDLTSPSSFYSSLKEVEGGKHLEFADLLIGKINKEKETFVNLPTNLYFKGGTVSASLLESFYSCPYKCFLKYGLGVKDSLSPEISSLDVGLIMHEVTEIFMKRFDEVKTEDDCQIIANEIIDDIFKRDIYARFLKRADYSYSIKLITKEASTLCLSLYRQSKNSDFVTIARELWFGEHTHPYKFIPLNTKDGKVYKLNGKVDRVDKYKNYVRIIDYKTGDASKKINNVNFYTGQNIQLYLYMNAFLVGGDKPAGAYYYGINDEYGKPEEREFSMHGKTLNDDKIILATDKTINASNPSSAVKIEVKTTKKSGESFSGDLASEETLNGYVNYAKLISEKAVDSINDGFTMPSPYEGACKYCEFGGACGFDEDDGYKCRKVKDISSTTIVNATLKKTENEGDLTISNGDKTDGEINSTNGTDSATDKKED